MSRKTGSNIAAADPLVRYADAMPDHLRRLQRQASDENPAPGWTCPALQDAIDEVEDFARRLDVRRPTRPEARKHLVEIQGLIAEARLSLCDVHHTRTIDALRRLFDRLVDMRAEMLRSQQVAA